MYIHSDLTYVLHCYTLYITKIRIEQLLWDTWNTKHIGKHNVSVNDAEYVIEHVGVHKYVKMDRILFIARVDRRIISVVVAKEQGNMFYVVSARDAAKKERRRLYEKENT